MPKASMVVTTASERQRHLAVFFVPLYISSCRRSSIFRVRPANYQSGWKLHGSDLRENRTVGSPWLVFHENGPYLVIWAFKKPKK